MSRQTYKEWVAQSTRLARLSTVVILLLFSPSLGFGQEDEIIGGGQLKYQQYCANCHGAGGKGDGDVAQFLVIKPADLTQLRKKNQEEFPFWQVYRVIDGREMIKGHGSREMPLWGTVFQREEE